ncbi:GerMN domain-containing protein [Synechococcus sp. W55.1]|uniref:GerMN domain-containing protein n=1 Tax=Synechococcus sp. W55.1 TaxID=2964512 RepID=UPI0039C143EC
MSHYGGRTAQLSSVRLGGRRSRPRRGRALQLGILGFLLGLGAMGAAWWYTIGPRQTLSLYWLTSADNSIYYVQQERTVRAFDAQEAIRLALEELIAGPRDPHLTSAIPPQTQVLDVRVEGDDIFLNFSPEFTQGGGSTAMMSRIAQVLYTATSQNPGARVWISVEGRALEVLGGEGLILDQPLTRASFVPGFQLPAEPEAEPTTPKDSVSLMQSPKHRVAITAS